MAYIACPECGQRALSVATRCPRCGHAFPAHPVWDPGARPKHLSLWPVLVAACGLVAVAAVVVAVRHRAAPRSVTEAPPVVAPVDTAASITVQPGPETSASTADSAPPVAPPSPASPAPAGPQEQRWARTWVNIRRGRGSRAPLVRVLSPGEAILVDSLKQGWYRVLVDGRTVGYVDRLYLDAVPPREHH